MLVERKLLYFDGVHIQNMVLYNISTLLLSKTQVYRSFNALSNCVNDCHEFSSNFLIFMKLRMIVGFYVMSYRSLVVITIFPVNLIVMTGRF